METLSRTEHSARNASVAMIARIIAILMGFVTRMVFTHSLSESYVGVSGLFSGIIQVLALSELGIGTAITFSLYEPIACEDVQKQKSIMLLYKKLYKGVFWGILILGMAVVPFLDFIVKDPGDVRYLTLIYILYVINASCSYLFAYKKTLIDANQLSYIGVVSHTIFLVVQNLIQILILRFTGNFVLFLIVFIICTLGNNIYLSLKANKMYPFLKDRDAVLLDKSDRLSIRKDIKAMMMHKTGNIIINNTDNILIALIIDVVAVGCYSNYYLVIGSVRQVLDQMFQGITASVGNLGTTKDKKRLKQTFEASFLLGHILYGLAAICLYELINPFIGLCFGEQYVFSKTVSAVLCINFYMTGLRQAATVFRESLGLFRKDWFKSIIEAVLNLAISIWLGIWLGVSGVFLGTLISMILTSLWIEPYVLYRYFESSVLRYYWNLIQAVFWTLSTVFWIELFRYLLVDKLGWIDILARILCTCIVAPLIFFLSSSFKEEYKFLEGKLQMLYCKRFPKHTQSEGMTKEEEVMLQMLSNAISDNKTAIASCDWMKLMLMANKHKVLPLMYEQFDKLALKDYERNYLIKYSRECVLNNYRLMTLTCQIQDCLKKNHVNSTVLKGIATARLYPKFELRKSGDIDLLIARPSELETVKRVLCANGLQVKEDQPAHHHLILCYKNKIDVEVHTMLAEPFDNEATNQLLAEYVKEIETHFSNETICGMDFVGLKDGYHAYELLLHMLQHYLRSGFGVKLLCDWVVFWNRKIEEEQIQLYEELVRQTGIKGFSDLVFSVCYEYLGLTYEEFDMVPSKNSMMFMKDILHAEEFGKSSKTRMVTLRGTSSSDYMREFHHQMKLNFPKTGKIFILWPVLWCVTLVRFLRNNRKLRRGSSMDILKMAGYRSKIVQNLHLFEKQGIDD